MPAPTHPSPWARPSLWLLGLAAVAWCALGLVVAQAWGAQMAWRQAHLQAQGQRPGAQVVWGRVLAMKSHPAHGAFPPTHQLLLDLPEVGAVPFTQSVAFPPSWRVGASVPVRQAQDLPLVRALDVPGSKAHSALDYWCQGFPNRSDLAPTLLPWLASLGALGSLGALAARLLGDRLPLWARGWGPTGWRRQAMHLGIATACLLASGLVARFAQQLDDGDPAGLATSHHFGPARILQVMGGPKPPHPGLVYVWVPEGWGPRAGLHSLAVGRFVAASLRPQQRLRVLPQLSKRQLVFAERVPGIEERLPYLDRFMRATWWGGWVLLAQAGVSLGLALRPWLGAAWAWARPRRAARSPEAEALPA